MRFHRNYLNQNKAVVQKATASFLALGLILITAQCSSLSPKDRSLREVAVGRALTARFAKADGILKNSTATSYVSLVGQAVVEAAGQSDRDYHFAILDTDESISVAGPGGYILISKGYIKSLNDTHRIVGPCAVGTGIDRYVSLRSKSSQRIQPSTHPFRGFKNTNIVAINNAFLHETVGRIEPTSSSSNNCETT